MTKPWRIKTAFDYIDWIADVIEEAGAVPVAPDYLDYDTFEVDEDVIEAHIGPQEIHFFDDGTRLSVDIWVDADGEVEQYELHYMHDDGAGICRLCLSDNHITDVGQRSHMHPGGQKKAVASDELDFDEAVKFLRALVQDAAST